MSHGVGSSVFRLVELKITFCVFPQIFLSTVAKDEISERTQ